MILLNNKHLSLGNGEFGEVYKGWWRGTEVAIKLLKRTANNSAQKSFAMEGNILKFELCLGRYISNHIALFQKFQSQQCSQTYRYCADQAALVHRYRTSQHRSPILSQKQRTS